MFNLKLDPSESDDLLLSMPERASALKEKLSNWETEVIAERLYEIEN
jgi:hypothetical protein